MMKKLLVSAFALAAFAGPAMAADLYTPASAMYDWNGAYLGGHAGYLWGDASITEDGRGAGGGDFDGFIGGVLGGWNFQSGNWVFGIEGDFGWTGADGTGVSMCDCTDEDIEIYTYDMDWNAHVRGRAGVTLGEEGKTLLFIAGGLAVADFQLGYEGEGKGGTYTGWTIGGGVNHAFSNNFIAGLEVLYDDYGSKTYTGECNSPCETYKVDLDAVTVRGTATYHFAY
jgi:outer membrane immunogenic protein